MKRSFRPRWGFFGPIFFVVAAVAFLVPPLAARGQAQDIQIGFFAPLSGDNAEYGKTFQEAINLSVESVNRSGGIGARMIRIVPQDDRADPAQAANIAQLFASNSKMLAAIGSFSSAASMAAAPVFQQAGMVQVSPTSSHPDFTGLGSYMFRIVATQNIEGPLDARFVAEKFKPANVAVVYRDDDWGVAANKYFSDALKQLGTRITISEPIVPGTKDLRPLVTKLEDAHPDVLFLALFYADAAILAKEMQQAGYSVPVVTNSSLFNPQLIVLGGDAVNGYFVPSNFAPDSSDPVVPKFAAAYRTQTGRAADQFAALAYDAVGVLVQAMRDVVRAGHELTRSNIRDALASLAPYDGVTGKLHFDENRNAVRENMSWLVIKDGRFQAAGK